MEKYRFVSKIGEGGFATVGKYQLLPGHQLYRKLDYVAIKRIPGDDVRIQDIKNEQIMDALNEASKLSQMEHEHIIRIVDLFLSEDLRINIVMQFADLGSLSQIIEGKEISEIQVWDFIQQIADAINYFHKRGLIHRDLKPDNILAFSRGDNGGVHLKVADFGISKATEGVPILAAHYMAGTPLYLAPEVILANLYTPFSDIWAFGAIIAAVCNKGKHMFMSEEAVKNLKKGKSVIDGNYSTILKDLVTETLDLDLRERPEASAIHLKALLVQVTLLEAVEKGILEPDSENSTNNSNTPRVTVQTMEIEETRTGYNNHETRSGNKKCNKAILVCGVIEVVIAVLITAFLYILHFVKQSNITLFFKSSSNSTKFSSYAFPLVFALPGIWNIFASKSKSKCLRRFGAFWSLLVASGGVYIILTYANSVNKCSFKQGICYCGNDIQLIFHDAKSCDGSVWIIIMYILFGLVGTEILLHILSCFLLSCCKRHR